MYNSKSTNRLVNDNVNVDTATTQTLLGYPLGEKQDFLATPPKDNTILGADKIEKVRHTIPMDYGLLDFNSVCKLLGVGRTTLYSLVNNKSIKAVKLLGRTLFRESDVRDFVASLPEYQGGSNGF